MFKKIKKQLCQKICPKKKPREIVIVYPFNTQSKKIFLIEEYIHHYKKSFWKFVSGGIDKSNTDNLMHAYEELAEEVSMHSDHIYHFHSSPRIFGNRGTHFYVAENPVIVNDAPENPDTDEIINQKWVTEQEFQEMLDSKVLLWDEGTMVALQVFRKYKNK